ncbi:C39 family peptidase [Companilactobacillus keshanensis]|uniref:C39 family peptidase n=1 Tax=Companilactobacillus keshanensis TaxID=2486003 RepID=A0ABW4BQF2_9LACO|nr:C39 family peptidase [Companilactobacillus keshanensis]
MGIKGKLILAVAASSMLFMTPKIVQADAVDQAQTVTPNDNSVSSTTNAEQSNNSVTQPVFTTPSSTGNTTATDTTTTTSDQNQYSDEATDGIFHVNGSTAFLYQGDGTRVDNRALGANTPWYTDTKRTWGDGSVYYRVSTNEYVNQTSGNFQNNVEDYSGTASVTYDSDVKLYQDYGKNALDTGNTVSQKSDWKVDKRVSNGGQYWYEVGSNVWLPQSSVVINDGTYPEADWVAGVPMIAQNPELPNGCEITAVTMMLQYAGANVNKMQLAYEMPRSSDPNYGYMGQPWDSTGVTIFPSALMRLVEKYAGSAKNLSGQGLDAIKYQISIGHPVVTWNTLHGFLYHALVVTGYDSNYIYYNDCWLDEPMQMPIDQFINNWNTQNRMAISY